VAVRVPFAWPGWIMLKPLAAALNLLAPPPWPAGAL
jgi:hypothetical protein